MNRRGFFGIVAGAAVAGPTVTLDGPSDPNAGAEIVKVDLDVEQPRLMASRYVGYRDASD